MLFATWLFCSRKLAPSYISTYLAAMRSLHIDLGFPDPMWGADRLTGVLIA